MDLPLPPTIDILGFEFQSLTERACVEHVLRALECGRGGWVVTPNLDILRMMSTSPELWRFLRQADLTVADGMPIVWASRILGRPLPERVAGSSLIASLSEGAAGSGRSLYLLGGDEGTADAAGQELRNRFPNLQIAGTYCPPVGFDRDAEGVTQVARRIESARPDIVFVALGCPKQERLIARIRGAAPHAWFVGVGISFSYLAGAVRRAPPWVRAVGLEWAFRLVQEPERLAPRYLRYGIPFALRFEAMALRARIAASLHLASKPPRLAPRTSRCGHSQNPTSAPF